MKHIIIIITCIVIAMVFSASHVDAKTKYSNLPKVKAYCHKYYKNYKIKVVKMNHVPKYRKSTKVIYIEKVYTKSLGGKKGIIIGTNYTVKYNRKVKKGVKQYCYFVYNPNNNNDIIACANCNTIECSIPVNCPNCDGNNCHCVYWIHNENRHMTEEEIADFEYWESHYIDESGNVHEF